MNIRVESDGQVDTMAVLTGPQSYELIRDDDSGAGFDPEIQRFVLPEDGAYLVLVRPYIIGDNGEVSVFVEGSALPSLDEGPQVARISDKQAQDTVVFEGVAGEKVLLSARVRVNGASEPRIEVWQGDHMLASNSIGNVTRLILEFVVLDDGPVRVVLTGDYYNSAVIEFSVEHLTE